MDWGEIEAHPDVEAWLFQLSEHTHTRWSDIKARRSMTPEMKEAYDRADRAFRFGAAVRAAREAAGLSQSALARRMGTNQSAIARLEMGGVDPKLSTIDRISRALGTELVLEFRTREVAATR